MDKIIKTIAEELNIKPSQVENTVKLIDEGNTIPFIARYRKEVTGGLLNTLHHPGTAGRHIPSQASL